MDANEIGLIVAAVGLVACGWAVYLRYLIVAPPNRALVIFGSRSGGRSGRGPVDGSANVGDRRDPRIVVGGKALVLRGTRGYGSLFLGTTDLDVQVRGAHAAGGPGSPPFFLRIGVQVKISSEPEGLRAAAENLLGKSEEEIRSIVRSVVEEHVPSVLAHVAADRIELERERIAGEIEVLAATDLMGMGLVVLSLGIKEVWCSSPTAPPPSPVASPPPSNPSAVERTNAELTKVLVELSARLRLTERRLEELERRSRTPEVGPALPSLAELPSALEGRTVSRPILVHP